MDPRVKPLALLYQLNTDLLLNWVDGLSDVRSIEDIFPVDDHSRLGMTAFMVQHDSYHLGQVAFLRRGLGKPPMSYARNPERMALR